MTVNVALWVEFAFADSVTETMPESEDTAVTSTEVGSARSELEITTDFVDPTTISNLVTLASSSEAASAGSVTVTFTSNGLRSGRLGILKVRTADAATALEMLNVATPEPFGVAEAATVMDSFVESTFTTSVLVRASHEEMVTGVALTPETRERVLLPDRPSLNPVDLITSYGVTETTLSA